MKHLRKHMDKVREPLLLRNYMRMWDGVSLRRMERRLMQYCQLVERGDVMTPSAETWYNRTHLFLLVDPMCRHVEEESMVSDAMVRYTVGNVMKYAINFCKEVWNYVEASRRRLVMYQ